MSSQDSLQNDFQGLEKSFERLQEQKSNFTKQLNTLQKENLDMKSKHEAMRSDYHLLKTLVLKLQSDMNETDSDSDSDLNSQPDEHDDLRRESALITELRTSNTKLQEENSAVKKEITALKDQIKKIQTRKVDRIPPLRLKELQAAGHDYARKKSPSSTTPRPANNRKTLLFLCDSNGKYLRLNNLCPMMAFARAH